MKYICEKGKGICYKWDCLELCFNKVAVNLVLFIDLILLIFLLG